MDPALVELPIGIRRFSDDAIQAAVDKALLAAKPESTFVVVAHGDTYGASLTAVVRLPEGFSVAGIFRYPYGGELSAAAEIRWER